MTMVPPSGGTYSFNASEGTQEFFYTPDVTGPVSIYTTGDTNADTYIDLYTYPDYNYIAEDDDSGQDNTHAYVVANLNAGVQYTFFVQRYPSTATFNYTLHVESGGEPPPPPPMEDSTNTTVYRSAEQGNSVVLAPADPQQTVSIPYKLSAGGTLWWQYTVQVNASQDQPSRAHGISTISVTNGATLTLWERPVYYLATFAEYDAIIAGDPDYGPGMSSVSVTSSFDPMSWFVKVTVPPGEGVITFTGPLRENEDRRTFYYSAWHDQSFYDATEADDPFYGVSGYAKYDIDVTGSVGAPTGSSAHLTERSIIFDYYNDTYEDNVSGPYSTSDDPLHLNYQYSQVATVTRQWFERQGGIHWCKGPWQAWKQANENTQDIRDRFSQWPLQHGNLAKDWAAPLPTEPAVPHPWVPAEIGWQVEWDYSVFQVLDLVRFDVIEEGYASEAPQDQVHYYRLIEKGGNTNINLPTNTEEHTDAIEYHPSNPGSIFQPGRVNRFQGTAGEVDNTMVSFAPDKHGEYYDFVWPDDTLIGHSIGWRITARVREAGWVRTPRYRYRRLYIAPGNEPLKSAQLPLRQRHRNDGLATDAREFKGFGSSQQISIRRGGRTYY